MKPTSPEQVNDPFTSKAHGRATDNPSQMKTPKVFTCEAKTELQRIVDNWRSGGEKIAFVPTMGALHEGHLSLVDVAQRRADRVIASIFVNPTQFAPGEDLDSYPRTLDTDLNLLTTRGCDLVYLPTAREIYPFGLPATHLEVPKLGEPMEGLIRPHFFGGVASVVIRLFNHVRPDLAVFGEKDYQQLLIVRRMVVDLGLDIEIIGGATGREPDGVAMSSRNKYLNTETRTKAFGLSAALHRAAHRIKLGTAVELALGEARQFLNTMGFTSVEYVELADAETLESLSVFDGTRAARVFGAAWLENTRLIDNMAVGVPGTGD